jgi:hypothetical protein
MDEGLGVIFIHVFGYSGQGLQMGVFSQLFDKFGLYQLLFLLRLVLLFDSFEFFVLFMLLVVFSDELLVSPLFQVFGACQPLHLFDDFFFVKSALALQHHGLLQCG